MRWPGRSQGDAAGGAPDGEHDGEPTPLDDVALGELLREARLSRAYTLEEVERDTRINSAYLEALEHGRYEVLPAPVYTRGFVRSYARHLGLDEEQALSLLPAELPRPQGLEPMAGLRRTPGPTLPTINRPLAAGLAAGAVVFVLALFALARLGEGGGAQSPGTSPTASPPPATSTAGPAGVPPAATVPPFADGEMPDLRGVDRETAEGLLDDLELERVVIEVNSDETAPGRILDQFPAPGAAVGPGDVVTLVISRAAAR